jgi:nicotinate dehydrogenase subunit B
MLQNTLPRSILDNPLISDWVQIAPSGQIIVGTGKVEIGQGVLTALKQMAAEELCVPYERVTLLSGETLKTPEEGLTSGSLSIEISGGSIRLVCAEVRDIFLQHAARELGLEAGALEIEDGAFVTRNGPSNISYWSLAAAIPLDRKITGAAPLRATAALRIIGQNLPRIDLPAKLRGAAFVHDIDNGALLHARILHAPRRNAQLESLDEAAIARTGARLLRIQHFVALLAEDEAIATAGLLAAARTAIWQGGDAPEPAHSDANYLKSLPSIDRVIEAQGNAPKPDPSATIVTTLESNYSRPFIAHGSIGPSCGLAQWQNNHLAIWSHTQGVGILRKSIADMAKLAPEQVTVTHVQGAGCYGHNGTDDAAGEAAIIALHNEGRLVRVQWTREDELSASPFGAASAVQLRAELDSAGRPLTWDIEIWSPAHTQRPGASGRVNLLPHHAITGEPMPPATADVPDASGGGGIRNAIALYDLPPQRLTHHLIPSPPLRASALRGLGAQANVFAIESFIDELAAAAAEDPVAYRLSLLSDPRARAVIEAAAKSCAWHARGPGGDGTGLGFAFSRYKNRAAYLAAAVEIELQETVQIKRIWCAVDAGLLINPDGAANQVEGGALQAASWTLKEHVTVDHDGISSRSWETYPILRFTESPEIHVEFIGSIHNPPLGVGEVSAGPVTAAIANAVAHAAGIRIRDLPISRDRIASALMA